jgi:preprotein translocase subunit SecG
MSTVLLVIHVFVAIALVGIILIQRSEGGGLGLGGSNSSGAFMSVRGTANLLTRTTAILAGVFMITSLVLAILAGNHGQGTSILDQIQPPPLTTPQPISPSAPAAPAATETQPPAQPQAPQVPLSK